MFVNLEDLEDNFVEHLELDLKFLKEIQKRWKNIY
jgi:hypothetical protein